MPIYGSSILVLYGVTKLPNVTPIEPVSEGTVMARVATTRAIVDNIGGKPEQPPAVSNVN